MKTVHWIVPIALIAIASMIGALLVRSLNSPQKPVEGSIVKEPIVEKPNEGISSPNIAPYCRFFQSKKTGLWVIKNMSDFGSMLAYCDTPTQPNIGFMYFEVEAAIPTCHVFQCKDTSILIHYWSLYWSRESKRDILTAKSNEYK